MTAPLSLALDDLQEPMRIRSRALGVEVWVVPDDRAGEGTDPPAYTAAECRLLLAMDPSPEQFRAVHRTKAVFEGELVLPAELGRLRRFHQGLLERYRRLEAQLAGPHAEGTEASMLQVARVLSQVLDRLDELEAEERDLP